MYQAILFDLDDTLFCLRGCEGEALQRTWRAFTLLPRLPVDYVLVANAYATISSKYWSARTADGITRYTREQVIELSWREFLLQYDLEVELAAGLAERFWSEFCRSSALNPGAEQVIKRLASAYRLGMITNGYSDSQRGRLEAAGLLDAFDPLLISEEVGVAKPDIQIFEMALAELALDPEGVLFVGDSISHDREGCLGAGIDFCHYCPQTDSNELPAVQFRITELTELIAILIPDLTP